MAQEGERVEGETLRGSLQDKTKQSKVRTLSSSSWKKKRRRKREDQLTNTTFSLPFSPVFSFSLSFFYSLLSVLFLFVVFLLLLLFFFKLLTCCVLCCCVCWMAKKRALSLSLSLPPAVSQFCVFVLLVRCLDGVW